MKTRAKKNTNKNTNNKETLDTIIKETIEAVEKGEQQIYDIAENARMEYYRTQKELEQIKQKTGDIIDKVDKLEIIEKKARVFLMEVSSNFKEYNEKDIFTAYENAKNVQIELSLMREKELNLRKKRNELDFILKRLQETMAMAENLVTQVGIVLKYLSSNLTDLTSQIEEIHHRQILALRIIKAQEDERKRVSREIHDGPAQSMANIVLRAELCEKLYEVNPEKLPHELMELKNLVRDNLKDLRKIIFDLRPMALDDLGIIPTLKRYTANFQEKYKTEVELIILGKEIKLSSALNLAIFRTVQEALTNIRKHASAKNASVKVEFTNSSINLNVSDDGIGFDPDQVFNNLEGECYGLIGLQERIELLEGQINISSSPKMGTTIKAVIPIH